MQTQPHLTVLELLLCGRSHLAQHHDVVIIDNLAIGRRVNIDHPRVTLKGASWTKSLGKVRKAEGEK